MSVLSEKTERIGNVVVKYIQTKEKDAPVYSDGMPENRLYMKFKDDPNYSAAGKEAQFSSWAEEYHLSPVRQNLLKWYSFDPKGTVLEIGAGCGALTGLLCERLSKVTALEYSRQRAMITAMRHSQRPNLEIIVGGFQYFESDEKFDYITIIGVLEYAGKFYGKKDPYRSFLDKARSMLKPQGQLILAIENKIGLKYITGAPEDHTGRVFESIYNYPFSDNVRTFCKKELTELLNSSGFWGLNWRYPWPDYKMPKIILSDGIEPNSLDPVWEMCPAKIGNYPRKEIFSEKSFGQTIAGAGLLEEFANSFLVIAETKKECRQIQCLRFNGANINRKPEFRTISRICIDNQSKVFIKSADNAESVRFLNQIAERESLAKEFFKGKAEIISGKFSDSGLHYPFLDIPKLDEQIVEAISRGDADFGKSIVDTYIGFVRKLPSSSCIPKQFMQEFGIDSHEITHPVTCLKYAVIDCIPRNIMVGEEGWYIVDHEWVYDFPMPTDFLIYRGISSLIYDLQSHIQDKASTERPVALFSGYRNRRYIPLDWVEVFKNFEVPLKQLSRWAVRFQSVLISKPVANTNIRLKSKPRVFTCVNNREKRTSLSGFYYLLKLLRKMV